MGLNIDNKSSGVVNVMADIDFTKLCETELGMALIEAIKATADERAARAKRLSMTYVPLLAFLENGIADAGTAINREGTGCCSCGHHASAQRDAFINANVDVVAEWRASNGELRQGRERNICAAHAASYINQHALCATLDGTGSITIKVYPTEEAAGSPEKVKKLWAGGTVDPGVVNTYAEGWVRAVIGA